MTNQLVRDLLQQIDCKKLEEMAPEYRAHVLYKFFDWRSYVPRAVDRAIQLGVRPGDRVLDVGCGMGYFVAAAQAIGAEVVGLTNCLVADAFDAIGIADSIDWWNVTPETPLPSGQDRQWDLVVCDGVLPLRIVLPETGELHRYGAADHVPIVRQFAEALRDGGRVELALNKGPLALETVASIQAAVWGVTQISENELRVIRRCE